MASDATQPINAGYYWLAAIFLARAEDARRIIKQVLRRRGQLRCR